MPAKRTLKKRQWLGLILLCLAVSLPFLLLYKVSKNSVINEVRGHAMGVAIAVAAGIDPKEFSLAADQRNADSIEYKLIQSFIDRIALDNPDVRYIYTMQRSRDPLAPSWMVEFVVDQPARDYNQDGIIDESEMSEPPGAPYDSRGSPELVRGFMIPSADYEISPDPPYPDLISGYAPIKNESGQSIGLVGVDITARTVKEKLLALQIVILIVWIIISALIVCVYLLYHNQRDAYERISHMSAELSARNELLRAANQELARMNERFESDLRLAQKVQQGFLPTRFPRRDRIVFDQYYLTCEILGGDLYDAFEIDDDHVGIYMADVAGHGVSAALVSGLLKMAVSTIRQQTPEGTSSLFIDLTKPEAFLRSVNNLLTKEVPEGEFITLIYCVFDLLNNRLLMASAGHPKPLIYRSKKGSAQWCDIRNGLALGIESEQEYQRAEVHIEPGDLVVFYTDGLTEAMNNERDEFGEERLYDLVAGAINMNAKKLNETIKIAVEQHRAGSDVSDDFTLLTVEVR
ncbi:MAG TPA: PP2C family protein-serine/threonine phosphatase [Kiritimatiellia bacterium]|nr:PP2C family protein-serine/threonine phosphatase [Kiritimatiellia bacterium]